MRSSAVPAIATPRSRVKVAMVTATLLVSTVASVSSVGVHAAQAGEASLFVVVQAAPAVAVYGGGIDGLLATNPEALGAVALDPDSPAATAYVAYLHQQRASLLSAISAAELAG